MSDTIQKHRMKKIVLTLLLVSTAMTAHAQDVVRIGTQKLLHYGVIRYMEKLAPKYNLKIGVVTYPGGTEVIKGLVKGDVEIGAANLVSIIKEKSNGEPIFIAGGIAKGGLNIIARTELGIRSVSQLKGRKIGVVKGSIHELVLFATLEKYSLTYSEQAGKDVQLVYATSYPSLSTALLTKNVDAICQSEPQAAQAVIRGYGVSIRQPYDTPIGEPVTALVMKESFNKESPDVAFRAIQCFTEATEMFMNQPDFAESFICNTVFARFMNTAEYREAIANNPFLIGIKTEQVQATVDLMVKYGMIQADAKKGLKAKLFVREELQEKGKRKGTR
ncbi:MAG: ABC transporter substrate-binding protein [Chlorobiales bacterium]|nr:ABC transporter substrate-binding protein [Chlorobiales bacterium]